MPKTSNSHETEAHSDRKLLAKFLAPSSKLSKSERLIAILHLREGWSFERIGDVVNTTARRIRDVFEGILTGVDLANERDDLEKLLAGEVDELGRLQRSDGQRRTALLRQLREAAAEARGQAPRKKKNWGRPRGAKNKKKRRSKRRRKGLKS